jgi:hypothetical protein
MVNCLLVVAWLVAWLSLHTCATTCCSCSVSCSRKGHYLHVEKRTRVTANSNVCVWTSAPLAPTSPQLPRTYSLNSSAITGSLPPCLLSSLLLTQHRKATTSAQQQLASKQVRSEDTRYTFKLTSSLKLLREPVTRGQSGLASDTCAVGLVALLSIKQTSNLLITTAMRRPTDQHNGRTTLATLED